MERTLINVNSQVRFRIRIKQLLDHVRENVYERMARPTTLLYQRFNELSSTVTAMQVYKVEQPSVTSFHLLAFCLKKTGNYNLCVYCSPNIIRVIKSRRMRWEGHVAGMWNSRGAYGVFVGRSDGKTQAQIGG
jgi:hypothetical protein